LFKVFGKLKSTSSINANGIGLGLTICKRICEFLGGSITVDSEEGKGSTFRVLIKLDGIEIANKSQVTHEDYNVTESFCTSEIKMNHNELIF
jgi:light-regulated signal transduction histidine kinase (bacteriophytochrome)